MRLESSQVKSTEDRTRAAGGPRRRGARVETRHRLVMDALETRELLATLPASTFAGGVTSPTIPVSAVRNQGSQSAPAVAVDPSNPQKLVSVWTRNDPQLAPGPTEIVQYAVSNDGGQSWATQGTPGGFNQATNDPTSSNPVVTLPQFTDASVAFDRNDNFYILYAGHKTDNSAGVLLLSKYDYSAGSPQAVFTNKVVYKWVQDPASHPTLAVDASVPTFADPLNPNARQDNPYSGNVYVAWTSTDVAPAFGPSNYDPNRIRVVASSDGGNTFSGVQVLNDNGNFGANRPTTPQITVSQGSPVGGQTANVVAPGQLTAVWDDWGINSQSSPPFDVIYSDRITNGAAAQTFSATPGLIADAGAGTPATPASTDFAIDVNVSDPRLLTLSNLTVNLTIQHQSVQELQVLLIPPAGSGLPTLTLVNNQTDAGGNSNTGRGVSGANLGVAADGESLGTIFDSLATRNIVDINATGGRGAAAPYIGHFQPEGGSLLSAYGGALAYGSTAGSVNSVNGRWTIRVTDFRNSNAGSVRAAAITLTGGFTPNVDSRVATSFVRAIDSGASIGAAGTRVAAAPVIAADSTLGDYSPYQGRIYVAFVNRNRQTNNPADNTDVFLTYSTDGGISWSVPTRVNDDNARLDGHTEGSVPGAGVQNTGRVQFQPNIVVDQANGTVVMSWYDAREDGSRTRVTTDLTTSIDGGQTFSRNVYANDNQTAVDGITGQVVALAPIPDNPSGVNATDLIAVYGTSQGLAAYGGHAYPVWTSNQNGGIDALQPFGIRTHVMTYAAGPRVVAITQGPVGLPGDTLNNGTDPVDGTPIASAFEVTFDRPIDPTSFTQADVQVFYHDTTFNNVTGGLVPVNAVTPVVVGPNGATTFRVDFAPRSGVGTYSLQILGTNIRDRVRSIQNTFQPTGTPITPTPTNSTQQPIGPSSTIFSVISVNQPGAPLVGAVTVNLSIQTQVAGSLTITLISPTGTPIVLASNEGQGGADYTNTTFDDSAPQSIRGQLAPFTGTFRPESPLSRLVGQSINGNWLLRVTSNGTPLSGTLLNWSLGIQPGVLTTSVAPGNKIDQNADANPGQANDAYTTPTPVDPADEPVAFPASGGTPFFYPSQPNTLPLIITGPHIVSAHVPGTPATADNLVLDQPVSSIDITFDRNMNPATILTSAGNNVIARLMGPTGQVTGPFTVTQPNPSDFTTFRVSFPAQQVSGTYTVSLNPSVADVRGNHLDTNLNAGVALLRGFTGPTDAVAPVTYTSSQPVAIPDTRTVVSTLTVPDNFVAQGLTVQLNILHNNDPDLQITLVSPDNIAVVLVKRGAGSTGTKANFQNTILDDNATTLIANGGAPFFGRYKPSFPLSSFNGFSAQGTWKLVIDDDPANSNNVGGSLTGWSLTFNKGVPGSGLGESIADQGTANFRIFNQSPTNPLSSTSWTSVGPASVVGASGAQANNGFAGRIGAIAVDPSDPSGNTVYVAGLSGGIWKTVNFLTNDPNGPTYIPLTDFGPNSGMLVSSIAVFPRNNDPRQSIIIAGTGGDDSAFNDFGNTVYDQARHGVGFLRSMDGGATWSLLDSTNNNLPFAARDHLFSVGSTSGFFGTGTSIEKVVVDPHLTPNGKVIVYAAVKAPFASNDGGLYRSVDTGQTWQKVSADALGDATDVALDLNSATVDAVSNPTGNVNIIYAAFPGSGVYISPDRGQVLNRMGGGGVTPLIIDGTDPAKHQVFVNGGANAPNGFPDSSRIVLAKPDPLPSTVARADVMNVLYQGWLYAAVTDPFGGFDGLYLTKDNGQTWTKLQIDGLPPEFVPKRAVPSNNAANGDYDATSSSIFQHSSYDLALTIDPMNPNVVYMGGTVNGNESGLIRIDATRVYDSHAAVAYDGTSSDSGTALQINTTGRAIPDGTPNQFGTPGFIGTTLGLSYFDGVPYINLLQDPTDPFQTNATVVVNNLATFANTGEGVYWTPIDSMLRANQDSLVPSSNIHQLLTIRDPLTNQTRLIVGDDQGVFSGVLGADGRPLTSVGTAQVPTYSRNGNLALGEFFYGAAQATFNPLAQFYANGIGLGQTASDPNVLGNGNIVGVGSTDGSPLGVPSISSADQAGTGVGVSVDAPHVNGNNNLVYRYYWPGFGGNKTDYFQVSVNGGQFISRTTGLEQVANDPQWPAQSPTYANGLTMGNFAVNPLNGDQVMISSAAGRLFMTQNQGQFWLSIAEPGALDGSYASALTFGAPDPNGPAGVGNLNNFLYAGTVNGNIFVSQTGGGTNPNGNAWTSISSGLDGSPVMKIIANPTRGSHEAYAVTQKGVYYIADSTATGASWTNITGTDTTLPNGGTAPGNLFSLQISPFGDSQSAAAAVTFLTSIQADWRYVIPNDPKGVNPTGTHPILYVSGNAGVYRSLDNGATWSPFPNQAFDNAPADGGYLPNVQVNDLTIANGAVDPTTGRAVAQPGDPNNLLATTFGRGQFTIRLAPIIFPTSVALDPRLPAPTGSYNGTDVQGRPIVTVAQPVIDGLSEQTAFGNKVRITILDLTDPNNPRVIGGYDPAQGTTNNPTDVPANWTDSSGRFQVQVYRTGFATNGVKTIGVQATDDSGTQGNIATLTFNLNATLPTSDNPTAPTLALSPASDSGVSNSDGITNNTNPVLIGTTDANLRVDLFLASNLATPVATTTSDAVGNFSFALSGLPDGVYTYVARATNSAGTTDGPSYTFTIDTVPPGLVPQLALQPSDDSGFADNITSVRRPHFINATGTGVDPGSSVAVYQYNPGGSYLPRDVLATTTADANGNFSVQLPLSLHDGTIQLVALSSDAAGNRNLTAGTPLTITLTTVEGDYVGLGATTPGVFRRADNGAGVWFLQGLPPASGTSFGGGNVDVPFVGDFDGSGVTSMALYRPSTNTWYIRRDSLGFQSFPLGTPGSLPAIGDFDNDGVTDAASYDPKTGTWTLAGSTSGTQTVKFNPAQFTPQAGDVPVPGNYDVPGNTSGVGPDLLAVYRPTTGHFYIQGPGGTITDVFVPGWKAGDVPVPGRYDDSATRHRVEPAVYDPTTGRYTILGPNGPYSVTFSPNDVPAPGDYNGDGRTDAAVYHTAANGAVTLVYSPNKGAGAPVVTATNFQASDIPLTAPLYYRNIPVLTPTIALSPGSDTGIPGDRVTSTRNPVFVGKADPNVSVDVLDGLGRVLGTARSDANGNYSVRVSVNGAGLNNGLWSFRARAHGAISPQGPVSAPLAVTLATVAGDYIASGKTQPAIYRPYPGGGIGWYVQGDADVNGLSFGSAALDIPISADVNGDGKTDLLVYRPSTAQWFVADAPHQNGYTGTLLAVFGTTNSGDIPVPADYLGVGRAKLALFRAATGEWFIGGQPTPGFVVAGQAGDQPAPGNYDNTGKAQLAVYRASTGQWFIQGPGLSPGTLGTRTIFFGAGAGNSAVAGNYDGAVTQPAVWNPNTGQYLIRKPDGSTRVIQFAKGDIPAPGDYEGTGRTQAAVFRPSTGQWFVVSPGQATPHQFAGYGDKGFIPVLAPYSYRSAGVVGALKARSAPVIASAAGVNLGSTALGLSLGTTKTAAAAPVTAAATVAPATPAVNLNAQPRLRPRVLARLQLAALRHPLWALSLGEKGRRLFD